jgi:hypothetical protein
MRKFLMAAAATLTLAASPATLAATEGVQDPLDAFRVELTLNNGQQWQTDEALRSGMSEIWRLLQTSLDRIHARQFTPTDYVTLADRLQAQVEETVAKCSLPAEADAQLHIVLAGILHGIDNIRAGERLQGSLRLVGALEAYGRYFQHPNWTSAQL